MNEVKKLCEKIKKRLKDKDLRYFYGVEYSSDSSPDFRARLLPSKKGAEVILIGGKTEKQLIKGLRNYLQNEATPITLAMDFLKNEIRVSEESITFNKNIMKEYVKKWEESKKK